MGHCGEKRENAGRYRTTRAATDKAKGIRQGTTSHASRHKKYSNADTVTSERDCGTCSVSDARRDFDDSRSSSTPAIAVLMSAISSRHLKDGGQNDVEVRLHRKSNRHAFIHAQHN